MIDRMLTAVNKGYWKAEPEMVARLQQANREIIAEAGVLCTPDTCSSAEIVKLAVEQDAQAMQAAWAQPAPGTGRPATASARPAARAAAGPATPRDAPRAAPPEAAAATPQPEIQGREIETRVLRSSDAKAGQQVLDVLVWLVAAALVLLGYASRRSSARSTSAAAASLRTVP